MKSLEKCCCCFGLQTGVIIIGWLGILSAVSTCFFAITLASSEDLRHLKCASKTISTDNNNAINGLCNKETFISLFNVACLWLILNGSLLWGACKKKKKLIIPWLAMTGLGIVMSTLIAIIAIINVMIKSFGIGIIIFCIAAFIYAFDIYIWLSVYALYNKLKEEELLNAMEDITQLIIDGPAEKTMTLKLSKDAPPAYKDINKV